MTLLQSLAIKLAMFAVAVGFLYWATGRFAPESATSSAQKEASAISLPSLSETQTEAAFSQDAGQPGRATPPSTPSKGTVTKTAAKESKGSLHTKHAVSFPINLATAQREDFMELPGIGEKLAERIVDYRKEHGSFETIDDLMDVKGIGKKRMERLRPLVRVAAVHD